ncbi:DUF742 domain-containing protein [Micromonospora sp. PLK6-60]|uniref:DUF742 domain-containing protein n=1 Tax=Micromonospora sp. PLK6-60 TaxID=2873383 RepID=UPI001CA64525|nr:DUF742 domain-containing protein [Micromonospora sp. PLK6-60]MBY8873348.1 DUF742 domain-containing protein [Micromonospora sp. PLK6-60]
MRADRPRSRHEWLDAAAGPVVRPYTLTGGRVRPSGRGLGLMALVRAEPGADPAAHPRLQPEHRRLVELTRRPAPVAELAAQLDVAVGVVRVLLGDLLTRGLVTAHEPASVPGRFDDDILKAVVSGLRAL